MYYERTHNRTERAMPRDRNTISKNLDMTLKSRRLHRFKFSEYQNAWTEYFHIV